MIEDLRPIQLIRAKASRENPSIRVISRPFTFDGKAARSFVILDTEWHAIEQELTPKHLTRDSDSILNLARLEHPFDYTIEVLTDYGPKTENVDLMETFNWLYGLRVKGVFTWVNGDPVTKGFAFLDGIFKRLIAGGEA